MSLKQNLEAGFPASFDFPPELAAFADWTEATGHHLMGLELVPGSRDMLEAWFGHPFASNRLAVFAEGPDGSLYAMWKDAELEQRVVFLGSEGEVRNLTADFKDFLRLVGIGYDEIGYADLSEPPEEEYADMEPDDDEFDSDTDEALPDFRVWLQREFSVIIPEVGEELVNPEDKSFAEWVERLQLIHGK